MKYTIEYYKPENQYIKISAEIKTGQSETVLTFPNWRPGRYELGNFAKNIIQFQVFDQSGNKLSFRKDTKNSWIVDTSNTDTVVVNYQYYAAELNAGSTFMDDQQLYVNPVNCLIYDINQQNIPCQLSLNIPDHFKIASGLPFKDNTLETKDYHELVDTPFICSASLKKYSYQVKDYIFYLWFQGEVKLDWPKIKNDFIKFSRMQINQFGGLPVKEYHFIYQITPYRSYHGVEHQHSTIITLGPTYNLMSTLYDDFLGISSHELYHTWNIKNIRPNEMMPYDYSKENYSRLGYIAEGVTTYLGDLYLSASKVKPWEWYKKEFEILMQRHFSNFGRFNYSVAESSWDTWLDGYVKGAPNRKVSIYNEGALLAFFTDILIRHHTENNASLHDVMKYLYEKFGMAGKGYTEQDYINAINLISGQDVTAFFNTYFHNPNSFEPVLVESLFNCGLELYTEDNPDFAERIIGIKTIQKEGLTSITDIYPGSSAEMATLCIGDQIISINGFKVSNDLASWTRHFENDQIKLTIFRGGRLLEITCPNTNRAYYPVYRLQKVKIPSSLQKRIFKKWCGYKWDD